MESLCSFFNVRWDEWKRDRIKEIAQPGSDGGIKEFEESSQRIEKGRMNRSELFSCTRHLSHCVEKKWDCLNCQRSSF